MHHEFALKFSVSKHRVVISFSSFMGKICFALAAASLLINNSRMEYYFNFDISFFFKVVFSG